MLVMLTGGVCHNSPLALTDRQERDSFRTPSVAGQASRRRAAPRGERRRATGTFTTFDLSEPAPRLDTVKHTVSSLRSTLVALLVLSPLALASEPAQEALATTEPTGSVPLVLGAPPAWTVMALGIAVVSITVVRRLRKAAPVRAPR
jgi:hypothetical protein